MGGFQGSLFSRRGFLGSSVALGSLLAAIPDAFADVVEDLAALGAKLKGDIILPASPDYEGARRTFSFNPRTGSHPRAIIRCKSEDDVIRALDYARKAGLEIAIRSGGHDVLGASTVENGIIIDLSGLDAIVADPSSGRVEIGGGVRARQLTNRLQEVGQAVALGCNPAVGVSGLTLGGGIGWLLGTSGAACDNLLRARVLTADGRFVGASAEEEPDLFWALRGGGGNFGIVTSLAFRTRPLASVIGGHLAYSGEDLRGFLEFYRDQMERAPAELVVEALIMAPSQPVIFAIVCYTGDAAGADAVLAPWRKFRPLLADSVGIKPLSSFSQPAPEVAKLFQGPPPDPAFKDKRPDIYWMGGSLAALTDGAIDSLVFAAKDGPPGWDIS
ncbi:MAG: FAD-dependent oxidoreductase, partial [Alphaproteobacteria bacterium]|nr:FAD-dependent oxidoreductase [Alphaproteobacteria bacterium]